MTTEAAPDSADAKATANVATASAKSSAPTGTEASAYQRLNTTCLLILTVIATAVALYLLRVVLVPLVLAIFISFAIKPIVNFFTLKLHVPRPLAIGGAFLTGFLVATLIGSLVSSSVKTLSDDSAAYQEQMTHLLQEGMTVLPLERFGISQEQITAQLSSLPVGKTIGKLANTLMDILSNAVLVLIFVVFFVVVFSCYMFLLCFY